MKFHKKDIEGEVKVDSIAYSPNAHSEVSWDVLLMQYVSIR